MTRDEALEILRKSRASNSAEENWIEAFVALGILKLEEPSDPGLDMLKKRLSDHYGYHPSGDFLRHLEMSLKFTGLRLVAR